MTHPTDPVAAMCEAWRDLCEKDDRTSPVEYPDMALITFDEFAAIRAIPIPAALPLPADPHAEQIAALPCGHHHSLGVRNIESNVVFCELCEARDELRDALTMERDLGEKVRRQAEQIAALTEAVGDVLAERDRQKSVEGWDCVHDDNHAPGTLARAGAVYALMASERGREALYFHGHWLDFVDLLWPWSRDWFKLKDDRRNLVRAGALILAEIERLDRAALARIDATKGEPK